MAHLNPGDRAPKFALLDQNSKEVKISEFEGQKLFIYFYPKANTSG